MIQATALERERLPVAAARGSLRSLRRLNRRVRSAAGGPVCLKIKPDLPLGELRSGPGPKRRKMEENNPGPG